MERRKVGETDLSDEVFGAKVKEGILKEVVVWQLAKRRAGTHDTKNRAAVSGGGRKPWRQKGTGRSRQGTRRAPQWKGGGVVFGPHPRDYSFSIPKKKRKIALCSALSLRMREGKVWVLEKVALPAIKTKAAKRFIANFMFHKPLFVLSEKDPVFEKSVQNIPFVKVLPSEGVNLYDVLAHRDLVFALPAVKKIEERILS